MVYLKSDRIQLAPEKPVTSRPATPPKKTDQNLMVWSSLSSYHWIGLRENLQEKAILNGKIYGFRLRFSLKPIHWSYIGLLVLRNRFGNHLFLRLGSLGMSKVLRMRKTKPFWFRGAFESQWLIIYILFFYTATWFWCVYYIYILCDICVYTYICCLYIYIHMHIYIYANVWSLDVAQRRWPKRLSQPWSAPGTDQ